MTVPNKLVNVLEQITYPRCSCLLHKRFEISLQQVTSHIGVLGNRLDGRRQGAGVGGRWVVVGVRTGGLREAAEWPCWQGPSFKQNDTLALLCYSMSFMCLDQVVLVLAV